MRTPVLRERGAGREAHVTNMELFFDLVFVFAIIQLSSHLQEYASWLGAGETAVMFFALWWAWNYTAWATGWIDPERTPVMLMIAVLMVLSLVMAASIPDAFHGSGHSDRGPAFAGAYVVLQLVRSGFMVWAFRRDGDGDGAPDGDPVMSRNYGQLLTWSAISGVAWVAGAFVHDDDLRLLIWVAAALLDLGAPLIGFWLPGRGATPMSDWSLAGAHLAERCQLLLMIAFGETVLKLGESFAEAHEHTGVTTAFIVGFLTSFSLWAIYFTHHAEHAAERIEQSEHDAAALGRSGYAYAHMLMVGGVIVLAVAEHLAVAEPTHGVDWFFALVCVGGPALYLLGIAWSKVALGHGTRGRVSPPLIGCIGLALLVLAASPLNRLWALVAALIVSAVLAIMAERDGRLQTS